MKTLIKKISLIAIVAVFGLSAASASALVVPHGYNPYYAGNQYENREQLLQNYYNNQYGYNDNSTYNPYQNFYPQAPFNFPYFTFFSFSNSFDDEPEVETENASDIEDDSAELHGSVDMNDFEDGIVFFVYGQDEDAIEDVADDYDEYEDVKDDEEDDDFEVEKVESSFDGDDSFDEEINNLEEDEEYFFVICVEYEDDDGDETIECGDLEDFETDDDSNDEEPDLETESATNVDDHSAKLRGSVDMNDFEDGIVFFVYGQDEDAIEDVADDYDEYEDVKDDEEDDDFEVEKVESGFDGNDDFQETVYGLEDDEEYFFLICVEYEDEDGDETLECGDLEDFETDD